MNPRIGSLCTGYGGLDIAVQQVFGGTTAWHCQYEPPDKDGREDKNQYAAKILDHHWPHIPNHGDLTAVDWDQVEPVDILTAGFPCQDVSLAGLRAGLTEGTRSGLWLHVARAIEQLRPRLVVIENVRGLLSAKADSDLEPCTWCLGDAGDEPLLRALGAVLADLARLGFDAEWQVVRASDVGAPHQRERVILLAWPADSEGAGRTGAWLRGRAAERGATAADAHGVGGERDRARGGRRDESASHGLAVADADRDAVRQQPVAVGGRSSAAVSGLAGAHAPADATRDGRHEGRTEPARQQGGSDAAVSGESDVEWGEYGPAVARWESVLRRTAPRPTDALGRLSPAFVEWMMGLPAGHVTSVPGLPRGAQLKALGNGVVPQQAAAALRMLAARVERLAVAS